MEASLIDDGILASFTEMVDRFVDDRLTLDRWRQLVNSADGFSYDDWHAMAQLGWQALPLAAEHGGFGGGALGTAIVMEAAGRGLMLEPFIPSVILVGSLLGQCTDDILKADLIPSIASGETVFALAKQDGPTPVTAQFVGSNWQLNGEKVCVLGGDVAQKLLVTANTADGLALFLVTADKQGLQKTSFALLDGRRAADLRFVDVVAQRLLFTNLAASLDRTSDLGTIAICCEALGAIAALNRATLEYVKTRKQFGSAIGKFQTIQHRLVDMHVIEQEARAIVRAAATAFDRDHEGTTVLASAAKLRINSAAKLVAEGAVQLHGGMGVTDELVIGHYFKRLITIRSLFGDNNFHSDRIAHLTSE